LLKNYNNWCLDIYRGLFIDRVNDNSVKIAPCCQAHPSIESIEKFNFVTSPYLTELRNKFDLGEKPKECRRCWHDESLGKISRRINISSLQEPSNVIELENLTHYTTWACNLACIMCGPDYSSTWAKELNISTDTLEKIGRTFSKSKNFLDKFDFSKIKRIHFNGGEPLLNNEHELVLEKFDKIGVLNSTNISYNTNGTQYPTEKTFELWSRAQQVWLWFSIDGTKNSYEYIRYPASWQATSDNLIALKNTVPENVIFGFNVTVGSYNVFEIVDVLKWVEDNFPLAQFSLQIAYNFDPSVLNVNAKTAAIDHLKKYETFRALLSHLTATMNQEKANWTQALDVIDQRRGTNWKKMLKVAEFY
jgi:sulfatase maturation enzyme AslB (radical SAM superfamily)